ncbi:MAG: type II toxin-antitoxin system VapC family toxin [Vicinamibacterales bacterium]
MNAVFVDTSAFLGLLSLKDENHDRAARTFATLRTNRAPLVTTSFVLVETYALIGRRFGLAAVLDFRADFAPLIDVVWVDETLHNGGLDLLIERPKRTLSLVDAVSFVMMRERQMNEAFAFDPHFEQEGFALVS